MTTIQNPVRNDNISALFVGLSYIDKDRSETKSWLPIVKIWWDEAGYYYYSFTKGLESKYPSLKGHVLNPKRGYTQICKDRVVPYFLKNRIPRRADSMRLYDLFGLGDRRGDFIALLARTGGKIIGDNYDIFPEVIPDLSGTYRFYFPIEGLANLIGNGSVIAKNATEQIQVGDELVLKPDNWGRTKIYYQKAFIGYAPNYVNYLLREPKVPKYKLKTYLVNKSEPCYAYRILLELSLNCDRDLFEPEAFQTINPM